MPINETLLKIEKLQTDLIKKIDGKQVLCEQQLVKLTYYLELNTHLVFDHLASLEQQLKGTGCEETLRPRFNDVIQALQSTDRTQQTLSFIQKQIQHNHALLMLFLELETLRKKDLKEHCPLFNSIEKRLQEIESSAKVHNPLQDEDALTNTPKETDWFD